MCEKYNPVDKRKYSQFGGRIWNYFVVLFNGVNSSHLETADEPFF